MENLDLPKPQTDLPLPEKEIPAVSGNNNFMKSNLLKAGGALLILVIIALVAYTFGRNFNPSQKACTLEAKICPDGSSVGREGPNCEFAKCPNPKTPLESDNSLTPTISQNKENWKTYINTQDMWQIDYPLDQNFKVETRESTQVGPAGIGTPVVFAKLGPTQGEGTELHDGIAMTVGLMKKEENKPIATFADEQTYIDPEIGSKTLIKEININGHKGVETTISGLGSFKAIFLEYPLKKDRVYYISIFSDGPGESNNEYDAIVEEMLSSFKSK